MPRYIPHAFQKLRPGATVHSAQTPITHGKAAQPAEDQQIESVFQGLELFISNHVEQFYDLGRVEQSYDSGLSGVMDIFDFEPTGPKGVKAGLRRYIASKIFKYVIGMTPDQPTTTQSKILAITPFLILSPKLPEYDRGIPAAFRDHIHRTLEPYVHYDKKSRWRLHLDDILKQGTELARLVSSQRGSQWRIGRFDPVTIRCDVRVFPSLLKNGTIIRREETQIGCGKPKEKLGKTSRMRNWGARQTSRLVGSPGRKRNLVVAKLIISVADETNRPRKAVIDPI